MPSDESIWPYDDHCLVPVEKLRQGQWRQSGSRLGRSWPRFAFLEKRELLAEEQVFGDERRTSNQEEPESGEQP